MLKLIRRMLHLPRGIPQAKTPYEQEAIKRHIQAPNKEIANLGYELYGLMEGEIRIGESIG